MLLNNELDVGAVLPHLRARVAVVAEAENVLAGLEVGNNDLVKDTGAQRHARSIARRRERVASPGVPRRVVAARAVAAGGFRARQAGPGRAVTWRRAATSLFAFLASAVVVLWVVTMRIVGQVAGTAVAVASARDRQPAPDRARGGCSCVDEDWVQHGEAGSVVEEELLLVQHKFEVVLLEARLG